MRLRFVPVLVCLLAANASAHFEDDQIYVLDRTNNEVFFVNPLTWNATSIIDATDGLNNPTMIGFSALSNMHIANQDGAEISEVWQDLYQFRALDGADGLDGVSGMAVDGYEWLYYANATANNIVRVRPSFHYHQTFADAADGIVNASGMVFDAFGDMYVANQGSGGQVLRIDPAGTATVFDTIAGEDPVDIVWRSNDDLYVACDSGNIYRYPAGVAGARVLLGSYPSAPRIEIDTIETRLIFSGADDRLRVIDLDTGVDTIVIDAAVGWDLHDIVVVGSQNPPGSYTEFGQLGLLGAGNLIPELHGDGNPRVGGNTRLEFHDFPGFTQAWLVVGVGRTQVPYKGGELYIDFNQQFNIFPVQMGGNPGVAGEGDWEMLTFTIPNNPALARAKIYMQAFALDSSLPQGLGMSHGLRLWVGE